MRKAMCIFAALLAFGGQALAHQSVNHHGDEKMKRLHAPMKKLMGSKKAIREAVAKGNFRAAREECEKMREISSVLQKRIPISKAKDVNGYRRAVESFRRSVDALAVVLESGYKAGIYRSMQDVDESCNACHVRYWN